MTVLRSWLAVLFAWVVAAGLVGVAPSVAATGIGLAESAPQVVNAAAPAGVPSVLLPMAKKGMPTVVFTSTLKLVVDVNPDLPRSKYWKIKLQRMSGSKWRNVGVYRTKGAAETRQFGVKAGTYRVKVYARPGFRSLTTKAYAFTPTPASPAVIPVTPPPVTSPPVTSPPVTPPQVDTTPHATAITPAAGVPGSSVTITGSNLGASGGSVRFGATAATTSGWSESSVVVAVPNLPPGGYSVTVVTASGQQAQAPGTFQLLDTRLVGTWAYVTPFGFQHWTFCTTGGVGLAMNSGYSTDTWIGRWSVPAGGVFHTAQMVNQDGLTAQDTDWSYRFGNDTAGKTYVNIDEQGWFGPWQPSGC